MRTTIFGYRPQQEFISQSLNHGELSEPVTGTKIPPPLHHHHQLDERDWALGE